MTRAEKYPETKWFVYENINPKNKVTTDCIIRATAKALAMDYNEVLHKMVETSIACGYHINDKKCLIKFLKDIGYEMMKQPRKTNNTKLTGKEFCEKFNKGSYICSIGGHHVTVIVDGKIHDIWDCSDKTIGNYWKVK